MESNNTIRTLFEFTEKGYDKVSESMDQALQKAFAMREAEKDLQKTYKASVNSLDQLLKQYEKIETTPSVGISQQMRTEYVKTKKAIEEETVSIVKNTAQREANSKARSEEIKKAQEYVSMAAAYKKVMDELSKGMDKAEVSTEALAKARKYLNSELDKTNINSEKHKMLSQELAQVRKAQDEVSFSLRMQVKEMGVAENSIDGMRVKLSALSAQARSLDIGSDEFKRVSKDTKALSDELIAAEAQLGVFSRNVGNYKSGYDGLSVSISQLTREAPAFAHSMTTGFMAISNNIPMLFDEINKLKVANAALNAEGQKTPPIWKSVIKAGLGWNTALSLGIVLLTVYGKDMVEWIGTLFQGKDALNANSIALGVMTEKTELLDGAMKNSRSQYGKQIAELRKLQAEWINLGGNLSEQRKFIADNESAFNTLGVSITTVKDAENLLVNNTDAFVKSIKLRSEAIAYQSTMADLYAKKQESERAAEKNAYDARVREQWTKEEDRKEQMISAGYEIAVSLEEIRKKAADKIRQEQAVNLKKAEEYEKQIDNVYKQMGESFEDSSNTLQKAGIVAADSYKRQEKAAKNSAAEIKKQEAAQAKANSEFIRLSTEKLKILEEITKSEIAGDQEAAKRYEATLKETEKALLESSKKRLTLSQLQQDELELQEYLHAQNIKKLQKDAAQEKADDYLAATKQARDAQQHLFDAQRSGNERQIELHSNFLKLKLKELEKFNADGVKLSEEQRLEEEIDSLAFQQKQIDDYKVLQTELLNLNRQYHDAKTDHDKAWFSKQIALQQTQVDAQVKALREVGIEASSISVEIRERSKQDQKAIQDALLKSFSIFEQYAGKTKNNFFKLSKSISGLIGTAFDLTKEVKKAEKDSEKISKLVKSSFEQSAAAALVGINIASENIDKNLEAQKEAIEEMYDFQSKMAKQSLSDQTRELDYQLAEQNISRAKHKLEIYKLNEQQAEKEKKLEKEKAKSLYDIEVKQFRVSQAKDAASAIIATSLAIMQGYAQTGPIGGSLYAAIMGAIGAAQVGLIYAQSPPAPPKFKKGGYMDFRSIDGPSHDNGGVPISIGGQKVAEAEGGEGALIISKKAMKNSYMRKLLAFVEAVNSGMSESQAETDILKDGGYVSYEEFFNEAKKSLRIGKRRKRSIVINGKKVKLKEYGFNADAAIDDAANKIAEPLFEDYRNKVTSGLSKQIDQEEERINSNISGNKYLQGLGIGNINQYNQRLTSKQDDYDQKQKEIADYKALSDAKIESLKIELKYEQQIADFESGRKQAANELKDATKAFSNDILKEVYESGQITTEEYLSLLDQIEQGYGAKVTDVIALKKKEIEQIKALINEERDAELKLANEVAKYRQDALGQIRKDWEEDYNSVTDVILDNIQEASEAAKDLTGTDLERYQQILTITEQIEQMNEKYQHNEALLTDGVVESRAERAALLEEQKRIKLETETKEKDLDEARKAFEEERRENMSDALKSYETENFSALLEQIKALGSELQSEGNKWTLDKQLAADLDENLKQINYTYDEQIAKQDAIIDGLQSELDKMQLIHDKKMANIEQEETVLKSNFEKQKTLIEAQYQKATESLRQEANSLSQFIASLKLAGIDIGLREYEINMEHLNNEMDRIPQPKFASGGVLSVGSGVFEVNGSSHSQGGVPVFVGNTQVAEVEGSEKMFTVNKLASIDPEMTTLLNQISRVNERYSGVSLTDYSSPDSFSLDYDLLAAKIGSQINQRPHKSYITHREISEAAHIEQLRRSCMFMQ